MCLVVCVFASADDGQSDDTVHALPLALLHGDAFLDNVIFGHDATLKGTPDRQLPVALGIARQC